MLAGAAAASAGRGLTEPGGGMVPGPVTSRASAPGSVSSSGQASGGANAGRPRSIMSSSPLAFASTISA